MEKLRASDWLQNERIVMYHEYKLQIARTLSKFRLSWLSVVFFHVHY